MEPSELDNIIRNKLQRETTLHQEEIEASKPFVWARIQANKTTVLPWYYSAAAAVLFFICFSWLFFRLQNQHQSEIQLLSQKVERLKNNTNGAEVVKQKNRELDLLCSELEVLEESLIKVENQSNPTIISKQIVYQTDTVFITKTEHITEYLPSPELQKKETPFIKPENNNSLNTTSDLIYPDIVVSSNNMNKETPSVKVTIKTLSSK